MNNPECIKMEMANKSKLNVLYSKCKDDSTHNDTTIFFIHGSMGCLLHFNDIIKSYDGRVNIVAYDAMGCGQSEKPTLVSDYSTSSLLGNLIQIFDKYSTSKNIFIGHSYGTAQIARLCKHIRSTQSNMNDDKKIKTINGVVLLGTMHSLPVGDSTFSIFKLPVWALKPLQGWMSKFYVDLAFSPLSDPALKATAMVRAGENKMYVCKNFYQQFEWAQEADWEALSFYPVLICQGEDDKVTPLEGAKILFRFLSSKRIERNTVIVSKSEAEDEAEAVATTDLSVKVKVEINETEAQDRIRLKIITQTSHQLLEEKPVEIVAHMDNFFRSLCDLSFIPESRLEV